jgi:hypothetical protein
MVLRNAGCLCDQGDVWVMPFKLEKPMIYRFDKFEVDNRESRFSEDGAPLRSSRRSSGC